jgi:hypothetical protein
MEEVCKIPKDQRLGKYFTPSRSDLKENCTSWPTFPHHLPPNKEMLLCLKFQMIGGCAKDSRHSHVLPSLMPPHIWKDIQDQIKKIFGKT